MKEYINPFLYNTPKIDLHGYYATEAVASVKLFIDDYMRIKQDKIIIEHGKGENILKKEIHNFLRNDKRVIKFELNRDNLGETIVYLKGDK